MTCSARSGRLPQALGARELVEKVRRIRDVFTAQDGLGYASATSGCPWWPKHACGALAHPTPTSDSGLAVPMDAQLQGEPGDP